jgi:putative transposase
MGRKSRVDIANNFYHCMNRANARLQINFVKEDYELFLETLKEAQKIIATDILAFAIMNNHFHLIIHTKSDGEMGRFMKRLTLTYTQRWHRKYKTVGYGHLFQGRYRSVLIKDQKQLVTAIRYVERNPFTARLVKNPLDWQYSSLHQRYKIVQEKYKVKLSAWPFDEPVDYIENLKKPLTLTEKELGVSPMPD